jgi:single-strand DNA-binding protein
MSARSLNRVTLIGNLTRDPEIRYTPGGTAVCTFGVATNRSWTPSDGSQTQEETEYHRIVAWSKLAEICSQLLFKGRKVYCEGRIQTRKWNGQDGAERVTTEIVIDNMIVLSPPKNDGYGGGGGREYSDLDGSYQAPEAAPAQSAPAANEDTNYDQPEEESVPEKAPKASKAKPEPAADEVDVDDIPF